MSYRHNAIPGQVILLAVFCHADTRIRGVLNRCELEW